MTIAQNLKKAAKDAAAARKAIQKELRAVYEKEAKEFFKAAPKGTHLVWSQYTPYFMDGDPCIFGVNPPEVRVRPLTQEQRSRYGGEGCYGDGYYEELNHMKDLPKNLQASAKALCKFIETQEDLMQRLYGDHCIVTLSAKGAEKTDYEHE